MNEETLQELAALHAASALEGADREQLEAQLALPAGSAAAQVAAFNDLAALFAMALAAPQEPPRDLKAKILARIAAAPNGHETASESGAPLPSGETFADFKFVFAAEPSEWRKLPVPGAYVKLLSIDPQRGYAVVLGKLDAGARYPQHKHIHGEQIYVLSGDLHIGPQQLGPGDFHHAGPGTAHGVNYSETGCVILAVISTADLQAQFG
jgi:quercetin dioxygenase-like cupin family protein